MLSYGALLLFSIFGVFNDLELFNIINAFLLIVSGYISNVSGFKTLRIEKELGQKSNNYKRALFGTITSTVLLGAGNLALAIALIAVVIYAILFLSATGPSGE